jgi:hypothetical protein
MKRSEHTPLWRKSSHSGGSSGDCVEVDAAHRPPSRSARAGARRPRR